MITRRGGRGREGGTGRSRGRERGETDRSGSERERESGVREESVLANIFKEIAGVPFTVWH